MALRMFCVFSDPDGDEIDPVEASLLRFSLESVGLRCEECGDFPENPYEIYLYVLSNDTEVVVKEEIADALTMREPILLLSTARVVRE